MTDTGSAAPVPGGRVAVILVELTNTPSDWPVPTWEAQHEV